MQNFWISKDHVTNEILISLKDLFDATQEEYLPFRFIHQKAFLEACQLARIGNAEQHETIKLNIKNAEDFCENNYDPLLNFKVKERDAMALPDAYNQIKDIIEEYNKTTNKALSDELSHKLAVLMQATLDSLEEFYKDSSRMHEQRLNAANSKFKDAIIKNRYSLTNPEIPIAPRPAKSFTVTANPNTGLSVRYTFHAQDIKDNGKVNMNSSRFHFESMDNTPINKAEEEIIAKIFNRTEEIAFQNYLDKKGYSLKNGKLTNKDGSKLNLDEIKNHYIASTTDPDARNNKTLEEAAEKAQAEYNKGNAENATNYKFKFQIKPEPEVTKSKTLKIDSKAEVLEEVMEPVSRP